MKTQAGLFRRLAIVAVMVIPTLGLAGCTTTGGSNLTAAEQQLRQTETKRIAQGAVYGAATGAVLGAAITAIAGGSSDAIARNALIGAGAGAVGGGLYANNVNQQTRPYAEQQERYGTVIAQADANIAQYRRTAEAAGRVASDEENKISRLNVELQAGRVTAADYRKQMANAQGNVRLLDQQIRDASADIDVLSKEVSEGAPESVQSRQATLIAEKATLEDRKQRLMQAYSRVPDSVGLNI